METGTDLMNRLAAKVAEKKDVLQGIGAVYKFALEGDGAATFVVDLKNAFSVQEGDGDAECTLRMSVQDALDLFEGRANGQALFFSGKLRIEGDMGLALRLQSLADILK
jgi:predicted lipid carrier protein YhbT